MPFVDPGERLRRRLGPSQEVGSARRGCGRVDEAEGRVVRPGHRAGRMGSPDDVPRVPLEAGGEELPSGVLLEDVERVADRRREPLLDRRHPLVVVADPWPHGDPPVADQPLVLEGVQAREERVVLEDRHGRVLDEEEVEVGAPEALEGGLHREADPRRVGGGGRAEDDHLAALAEGLPEEPLSHAVAVGPGLVVRDPRVVGLFQQRDGAGLVRRLPPRRGERPEAEADLGDLDLRLAQLAVAHRTRRRKRPRYFSETASGVRRSQRRGSAPGPSAPWRRWSGGCPGGPWPRGGWRARSSSSGSGLASPPRAGAPHSP